MLPLPGFSRLPQTFLSNTLAQPLFAKLPARVLHRREMARKNGPRQTRPIALCGEIEGIR